MRRGLPSPPQLLEGGGQLFKAQTGQGLPCCLCTLLSREWQPPSLHGTSDQEQEGPRQETLLGGLGGGEGSSRPGKDSLLGQDAQLRTGRLEQPQEKAQQPGRREGPGSPRLEAVRGSAWILPPREKRRGASNSPNCFLESCLRREAPKSEGRPPGDVTSWGSRLRLPKPDPPRGPAWLRLAQIPKAHPQKEGGAGVHPRLELWPEEHSQPSPPFLSQEQQAAKARAVQGSLQGAGFLDPHQPIAHPHWAVGFPEEKTQGK